MAAPTIVPTFPRKYEHPFNWQFERDLLCKEYRYYLQFNTVSATTAESVQSNLPAVQAAYKCHILACLLGELFLDCTRLTDQEKLQARLSFCLYVASTIEDVLDSFGSIGDEVPEQLHQGSRLRRKIFALLRFELHERRSDPDVIRESVHHAVFGLLVEARQERDDKSGYQSSGWNQHHPSEYDWPAHVKCSAGGAIFGKWPTNSQYTEQVYGRLDTPKADVLRDLGKAVLFCIDSWYARSASFDNGVFPFPHTYAAYFHGNSGISLGPYDFPMELGTALLSLSAWCVRPERATAANFHAEVGTFSSWGENYEPVTTADRNRLREIFSVGKPAIGFSRHLQKSAGEKKPAKQARYLLTDRFSDPKLVQKGAEGIYRQNALTGHDFASLRICPKGKPCFEAGTGADEVQYLAPQRDVLVFSVRGDDDYPSEKHLPQPPQVHEATRDWTTMHVFGICYARQCNKPYICNGIASLTQDANGLGMVPTDQLLLSWYSHHDFAGFSGVLQNIYRCECHYRGLSQLAAFSSEAWRVDVPSRGDFERYRSEPERSRPVNHRQFSRGYKEILSAAGLDGTVIFNGPYIRYFEQFREDFEMQEIQFDRFTQEEWERKAASLQILRAAAGFFYDHVFRCGFTVGQGVSLFRGDPFFNQDSKRKFPTFVADCFRNRSSVVFRLPHADPSNGENYASVYNSRYLMQSRSCLVVALAGGWSPKLCSFSSLFSPWSVAVEAFVEMREQKHSVLEPIRRALSQPESGDETDGGPLGEPCWEKSGGYSQVFVVVREGTDSKWNPSRDKPIYRSLTQRPELGAYREVRAGRVRKEARIISRPDVNSAESYFVFPKGTILTSLAFTGCVLFADAAPITVNCTGHYCEISGGIEDNTSSDFVGPSTLSLSAVTAILTGVFCVVKCGCKCLSYFLGPDTNGEDVRRTVPKQRYVALPGEPTPYF